MPTNGTLVEPPKDAALDGDIRRLRVVADALDDAGVHWWVDHGTLLGLVREGGFLPWDDDLDLSFRRCDHAEVVAAVLRHKPELRARMIVTARGVKLLPHSENERVLDISSYVPQGDELVKTFVRARRGHGGRTRRWSALLYVPFALIETYLHGLDRHLWAPGRRWPAALGRTLIALVAWPAVLRERAGIQQLSKVPKSLLERRERRVWYGAALPVPSDAAGYLEHRYGADWRTPRRTWTWWDDDHTVASGSPPS